MSLTIYLPLLEKTYTWVTVKAVDDAISRCLGLYGRIVAAVYTYQTEKMLQAYDPKLSYTENYLHMCHLPTRNAEMLEKLWIISADHELTNSTAAFLHAASTLADPLSAMIASIASGYGILHGGAIEAAHNQIQSHAGKVAMLIQDVKAKKIRLLGYGHRIYKTTDPRTTLIREILSQLPDTNSELLKTALEIDRVARNDEYFISRHLNCNADLFASFAYNAM